MPVKLWEKVWDVWDKSASFLFFRSLSSVLAIYSILRNFLCNSKVIVFEKIKGELNPKIDFSSFLHLGIVEQLYEVFLYC